MKKSMDTLPRFQPEQLAQIANIIKAQLGLDYTKGKLKDLERRLYSVIKPQTPDNFQKTLQLLLSGQLDLIPGLINTITISETYFLRNKRLFTALKQSILPEIIERKKFSHQMNIWSAGCSSGEEAYSVAILLYELLGANHSWQLKIIATDLNPEILKKARRAVYTEWSFRGTPPWFKEKYFDVLRPGQYRLKPEIRELVTFLQHNLVAGPYPPVQGINEFDIIFCRNVLIYMPTQTVVSILNKFYDILSEAGYLITGPSEFPTLKNKRYKSMIINGTIVYRKATSIIEPDNEKKRRKALPSNFSSPKRRTKLLKVEEILPQKKSMPTVELEKMSDLHKKQKETAIDELKLISELADNGRLDEARELCENYVSNHSLDENGYYLLGNIYLESGDLKKAEENFNRAIYLNPNFVMAHFSLANIYSMQNEQMKARRYFKNVLNILKDFDQETPVPESGGLVASQFSEMVNKIMVSN